MAEKIVLITAGGEIASFHAGMKRMYEVLRQKANGKFELWGASGGFRGYEKMELFLIKEKDLEPSRAGSLIGADRRITDLEKIVKTANSKKVYATIVMGGNNHMGEGEKMFKRGMRVVGYPKTMDFDLSSFITLGYEEAVHIGARETRNHHNTAMTNRKVFYVPLFGRESDWILTAVTAYGCGDRGIPCEQRYCWLEVWNKINDSLVMNKEKYGIEFAVVPCAEGVDIKEMNSPPEEHREVDAFGQPKFRAEWVGMELERLTKESGKSARFEACTYAMRDSPPTITGQRLSSMAGEECINMILEGDFGKSVIFKPGENRFYKTGRAPMKKVSKQRFVQASDFFDYSELRATDAFLETYGDLFRASWGFGFPRKEDLVYKNMLHKN